MNRHINGSKIHQIYAVYFVKLNCIICFANQLKNVVYIIFSVSKEMLTFYGESKPN